MPRWEITDEERRNVQAAEGASREHAAEWRRKFEAAHCPIGPLMDALLHLQTPSYDLESDLGFRLETSEHVNYPSPRNVVPFAGTGCGDQFGFLLTGDSTKTTDERPVCYLERGDAPHVIAPDLARFLSLLSVAGAWDVGRDISDDRYRELREKLLADPEGGEGFRAASEALLTLPGVTFPRSPSDITQMHPDGSFDVPPSALPVNLTLPSIRELWAGGQREHARTALRSLIEKWLDWGDLVNASNWSALRTTLADIQPELSSELREGLLARGALP